MKESIIISLKDIGGNNGLMQLQLSLHVNLINIIKIMKIEKEWCKIHGRRNKECKGEKNRYILIKNRCQ